MLQSAGIEYSEFACQLVETAMLRTWSDNKNRNAELSISTQRSAESAKAITAETSVAIRPLEPADHASLVEMTRSTAVFRPDEIDIADEVLRDANRDGLTGHYQVLVAELAGQLVGWSCHGRVPLTDAAFDLYWIVVDPSVQGRGIGRQLLSEAEQHVQAAGGRWLLAETSSTPAYEATRNFYLRCSYQIVSQIDDFYRAGDGKVTFGKRLDQL
jgi:ribosomal protein S18 acetylase RimI-like enzyme